VNFKSSQTILYNPANKPIHLSPSKHWDNNTAFWALFQDWHSCYSKDLIDFDFVIWWYDCHSACVFSSILAIYICIGLCWNHYDQTALCLCVISRHWRMCLSFCNVFLNCQGVPVKLFVVLYIDTHTHTHLKNC